MFKGFEIQQELESATTKHYVYDDDKIALFNIRTKAIDNAPLTWRRSWGSRFADYARGEIRWLEALESHPLRTRNMSEATFFVVPIPLGAVLMWGGEDDLVKKTLREAFRLVLNGPLF